MKKKLLAAAILTIASIPCATVFAQQSTCTENSCTTEASCLQQPKKGACPFDGLNLSADQQTKLKALADQRKADREKAKADRKQERKDLRAEMKGRRAEYLAQVKAILTPEQYVQFLENEYLSRAVSFRHNDKVAYRHHGAKKDTKDIRKDSKDRRNSGKDSKSDRK